MKTLMTANEVASMLQVSSRQVYELTKDHARSGAVRLNPLPCVRINSSVRFIMEEVEAWIEKLSHIPLH